MRHKIIESLKIQAIIKLYVLPFFIFVKKWMVLQQFKQVKLSMDFELKLIGKYHLECKRHEARQSIRSHIVLLRTRWMLLVFLRKWTNNLGLIMSCSEERSEKNKNIVRCLMISFNRQTCHVFSIVISVVLVNAMPGNHKNRHKRKSPGDVWW